MKKKIIRKAKNNVKKVLETPVLSLTRQSIAPFPITDDRNSFAFKTMLFLGLKV